MLVLVLSVSMISACHESIPSCGAVRLTFAPISATSPDVGTRWSAAAAVAGEGPTSPPTEFLTAENAQAQLELNLPAPLTAGQTIDATFVDGMAGLHRAYYWVHGGTPGSWYSTAGTIHVDALDPIQVTLSNITMDVYPFYPKTAGSFTLNGSGEWSAALPCSLQQPPAQ